jgi:periplasmic divalent cation tolerance protein
LILKHRVAACVNLVRGIDSWYWWQGKVEHAPEILLLIKTVRSHLKRLHRLIKTHHSYDLPELIALPIRWGDPAYLNWMGKSMRGVR